MIKKTSAGITVALSVALVSGLPVANAADHMSKDQAGQIVTDKYGGEVINVEEESDGAVYEVEVKNSDQGRIEVDVDAAEGSGDILEVEYENDNKEDESSIISEDKAEQTAVNQYGGNVKETELEHEDDSNGNSVLVYEIELRGTGEGETEVDVNAHTGDILGKESDNGDDEENASGSNENNANANNENNNEVNKDNGNSQGISQEAALKAVQDQFGGEPDGDMDDAVESEDDGATWEVEVIDSSKGNIEVDVDADTGDINQDSLEIDNISKKEAGHIATEQYGGSVKEIEQEHENGVLVYEVELANSDKGRIEVDVAAGSGDIKGMEEEDSDQGATGQEQNDHMNGTGDNNQGDNSDQQGNSASGQQANDQEGGELPETSTQTPLGMLIGTLLTASGGGLFLLRKKLANLFS